jgi:hypothetical protein
MEVELPEILDEPIEPKVEELLPKVLVVIFVFDLPILPYVEDEF